MNEFDSWLYAALIIAVVVAVAGGLWLVLWLMQVGW